MKENSIDNYLNAIKSASLIADASRKNKLIYEAREIYFKEADVIEKKSLAKLVKGNTSFEELTSVGYYPQERRLEATLSIKRPYGYGGNINNHNGSMEYVAFYVNWNSDANFNDFSESVGAAYVQVFDPTTEPRPINYAVYRDIIPPKNLPVGAVIKVRAILSWNQMPTGPNFVPRWGNVVESLIRHQPVQ